MNKIHYSKPALSVADQVALLKARGIVVNDPASAARFLTYHNYYYVSGYVFFFERKGQSRTHRFETAVSFEQIVELMAFDQGLRERFFAAVQSVEMAIRCSLARHVSLAHGPFCLEMPEIFRRPEVVSGVRERLLKALDEHRNEPFIAHFTRQYTQPIPPVWVMTEVLTFGTISYLYSQLRTDLQKAIAADFAVDHMVLVSWLKTITELRNTCAHHTRLWNKTFVNAPMIRRADQGFPLRSDGRSRLGAVIPLLSHLLATIEPTSTWTDDLREHLRSCPHIRPDDLGLTAWWGVA